MSTTEQRPKQQLGNSPSAALPRRVTRSLWPALARRLRLIYFRARYARAQFGAGCDIRPGLCLNMSEAAEIVFGSKCVLDRGMTLEAAGSLIVGNQTIFGHHCTLAAKQSIVIGDDCLIAEMVSIRDHDHRFDMALDVPIRDQGFDCRPIRIGRNVWIGGKATIVKGVTIGDNAIVGANSVVTHDIPANAIAVGAPARIIRYRTDAEPVLP
ncbi:MAG: acyltransferase [Janthinobacterium lividum]